MARRAPRWHSTWASGARLLVAWTAVRDRGLWVTAALGRVRGVPVVTRLFGVQVDEAPVALVRGAGEARVVSTSPPSITVGEIRTSSTD